MDRALLLLHFLRTKGLLRRWGKTLRSVKGILFTLVGMLVFVPWILSVFFAPRSQSSVDPATMRRFGPLGLLLYAILSIALSTGERVLYFTPAEIGFLFPAPFSRKSLLRFKIIGVVLGCAISTIFISVGFGQGNRRPLQAYVGLLFVLLFFHLMGMAVSLAAEAFGAMARTFRRRLALGLVAILLAAALISLGRSFMELTPSEMLARVEASPVIKYASMPMRPFVETFTAERIWPDMIGWAAVCAAMTFAMGLLVFVTDAQYLESSAASSEKMYQRMLRVRKGGLVASSTKPVKTGFKLAMLPWLGGAGPILWRQLASALRSPWRMLLVFAVVLLPIFLIPPMPNRPQDSIFLSLGMGLWFTVMLTPMIAFDFRGDVDRMEVLKTLPTSPIALVIGQVLTPVLMIWVPQMVGVACMAVIREGFQAEHLIAAAIGLPAIFLLIGIENLLFLFFPTRMAAANPADVSAFGRQIFLMLAKIFSLAVTLGVSALVGVGVVYLFGAGRFVGFAAALVVACLFASILIPLMAFAFLRYDVARDTPA